MKRILTAVMLSALALPAFAQYPERPITLIVPWSAGGGTDAVGRMLSGKCPDALRPLFVTVAA